MRFLLTSGGITNTSIHHALEELLGKPIVESSALYIPTGVYAIPNGVVMAARLIRGDFGLPFSQFITPSDFHPNSHKGLAATPRISR